MCNADSTPNDNHCHVSSCVSSAICKGLCAKHYQAQRKYGDPLGRAEPKRAHKDCEWCGKTMTLRPAEAKKRKACSRDCGAKIRNGGTRERVVNCHWCHKPASRVVRKTGDRGMYCSKSCGYKMQARLRSERAALRRMAGQKARREAKRALLERQARMVLVSPEIRALKRIHDRAKKKKALCRQCGSEFFRSIKRALYCSQACRSEAKDRAEERRRTSESYRASRAKSKAKRRARVKARFFESIDPVDVFEESGWRCYICGVYTPQDKRGSYEDDAPELDHIYPLAAGGVHARCNVACCCRSCNLAKGADIIMGPALSGRGGVNIR